MPESARQVAESLGLSMATQTLLRQLAAKAFEEGYLVVGGFIPMRLLPSGFAEIDETRETARFHNLAEGESIRVAYGLLAYLLHEMEYDLEQELSQNVEKLGQELSQSVETLSKGLSQKN